MVSVHLQMIQDRDGTKMPNVDMDVFTFHNKSGSKKKDIPVKLGQAYFVAREIAKVKQLRQHTHVFTPCDFNSHMTDDSDDIWAQFAVKPNDDIDIGYSRAQFVRLFSAYKDIFNMHPLFTCIKTRHWTDYKKGNPNQPDKCGTTSNSIDSIGHCVNSIVLQVSDLMCPSLDDKDYWKTFPSASSFSDHGVPLVAEFALTRPEEFAQNLRASMMLKKANEDAGLRGIVDGKLRRMEEVKALANKMDCSIRTHILMREFGRAQKDGRTPDELKTYTTALINSCDGKKPFKGANAYIVQIKKSGGGVDLIDQTQYVEKFRALKASEYEEASLEAGVNRCAEFFASKQTPLTRRRLTAKHVLHRRRLVNGARNSPVLADLMKDIEEAKRAYNSRCR